MADAGGAIGIAGDCGAREAGDLHHAGVVADPGEAVAAAAQAQGLDPAAALRDLQAPFLAEGNARLLQAHKHGIALGGGAEQIGATIAVEVGAAQATAVRLTDRIHPRFTPGTRGGLTPDAQTGLGQQSKIDTAIAIEIAGKQGLRILGHRIEHELRFVGPAALGVLATQHKFLVIGRVGDVGTAVAIPVTDGECMSEPADDERLFVEAGNFQHRVPAIRSRRAFRFAGARPLLALEQEFDAGAVAIDHHEIGQAVAIEVGRAQTGGVPVELDHLGTVQIDAVSEGGGAAGGKEQKVAQHERTGGALQGAGTGRVSRR